MNTFGDLTLSDLHELGWTLVLQPLSSGSTLAGGHPLDAPLEEYQPSEPNESFEEFLRWCDELGLDPTDVSKI